ncbi:hypothetical protein [Halomarina pelagica]|uniref:hypothetical protein n=1 Tax=Halomarina pelagica TaxID=2961599 RepID=UPI0020C29BCD|nr:hypothetical protein [Halomarina sp. BND7]
MTEAAALVIIAIAWIVMFVLFVVARAMLPRALHYGEAERPTPGSGEATRDPNAPGAGRGAV